MSASENILSCLEHCPLVLGCKTLSEQVESMGSETHTAALKAADDIASVKNELAIRPNDPVLQQRLQATYRFARSMADQLTVQDAIRGSFSKVGEVVVDAVIYCSKGPLITTESASSLIECQSDGLTPFQRAFWMRVIE